MRFIIDITDKNFSIQVEGLGRSVQSLDKTPNLPRLAGALIHLGQGNYEAAAQLLLDIQTLETLRANHILKNS